MDFTLDLTAIFTAILAIISGLVTTVLVPFIKSKLTESQETQLSFWVGVAVQAAEQVFDSGAGDKKYSYVVEFLSSKGLTFDEAEIKALIESTVYEITGALTETGEIEVVEE